MVLAANEETGEVAYKEVFRTFVNTTDEITHVTIWFSNGTKGTVEDISNEGLEETVTVNGSFS